MHWFGSSVWVVRLPVALTGAITVFIFYHLIRGIESRGAAVAACAGAFLLATDPVFLLTNTFDWGPVALEHVLLVTVLFPGVPFHDKPAPNPLPGSPRDE